MQKNNFITKQLFHVQTVSLRDAIKSNKKNSV